MAFTRVLLGAIAVALISCSEVGPPPVTVASVSMSLATVELKVGETQTLSATAKDGNGGSISGRMVSWATANSAIASVTNGSVTGVSAGITNITATVDGKTGTTVVTVLAPVATVTISAPQTTISVGASTQLSATTLDQSGATLTGRAVTWSTSNSAAATVNASSGLVNAIAPGTATITATSEGKTGAVVLTIREAVATVTVTSPSPFVVAGNTMQLEAALKSSTNVTLTGRTVAWSSSNQTVAQVNASGLVTAVATGSTTITASSEGKTGSVNVSVTASAVTPLTSGVAVTSLSGAEGSSRYFSITVPTGATRMIASISGGTGDADLYRRVNGLPEASITADGCDVKNGNSESCTINSPSAGTWYFLLHGYRAYAGVSLTVTVEGGDAPGFTIAASPASLSLASGATSTVTVSATRTGGFTGDIALTVTDLPNGVTGSFSPATLTGQASSTLTLVAASSAAASTATAKVRANATGQSERTADVAVTVTSASSNPAIAVALSPASLSIAAGQSGTTQVTLTRTGGFGGSVTLSIEGLPSNVSASFNPSTLTSSQTASTLTISAASSSVGGASTVIVRGTGTGVSSATGSLALTVTTPGSSGGFIASTFDVGDGHVCAKTTADKLYCWGANGYGQLGTGVSGSSKNVPQAVTTSLTFTTLAIGGDVSCGLVQSGAAYCWGRGLDGASGTGATNDALTPTAVAGGLTFTKIAVGSGHGCGIASDQKAYCWGSNVNGLVGDGSGSLKLVPTAVAGGHQFKDISIGGFHACAVTVTGAGYCWGNNETGFLTNAVTRGIHTTPVAVLAGMTLTSIRAGNEIACALTTAGAVHCWGSLPPHIGTSGSPGFRVAPKEISAGMTFASIASAYQYACGLTTAGAAYCWGEGFGGLLGNNADDDKANATPVSGGHTFTSIRARNRTVCGTTTAGTLLCWGSDTFGQLGDGPASSNNARVPAPVNAP